MSIRGERRKINEHEHNTIQEIDKLKINKSPGVDEVFPRVLKECRDIISVTLT